MKQVFIGLLLLLSQQALALEDYIHLGKDIDVEVKGELSLQAYDCHITVYGKGAKLFVREDYHISMLCPKEVFLDKFVSKPKTKQALQTFFKDHRYAQVSSDIKCNHVNEVYVTRTDNDNDYDVWADTLTLDSTLTHISCY